MNVWNMLKRKRKDQMKVYGTCNLCMERLSKNSIIKHFSPRHPHIKIGG